MRDIGLSHFPRLFNRVYEQGLGLLIFQHYGWDELSTDGRWWGQEMRTLELDILCRRDAAFDPGMPYNVVAICTGHDHAWKQYRVYAGKNVLGEDVFFDNLTFDDAESGGDQYGYSIVSLTGEKILVRYKDVADPDPEHCFLGVALHEEAFRNAGLRDVRWHQSMVSPEGIVAHGVDYWRSLMDHPPVVGIECLK